MRGRDAALRGRPGTLDLGYLASCAISSDDEVWRWFVTPFLHGDQLGYGFVALVAVGIFGTLLERRFGLVAVVATFILCGAAGAGARRDAGDPAAALGRAVLDRDGRERRGARPAVAWLVDDRLAARRGDDRENDLLGVYVIAAVLVLLSLTTEEANIAAAVGGALAGSVLGLLLPRLTRTP